MTTVTQPDIVFFYEFLTVTEAAAKAKVSISTVKRAIEDGNLIAARGRIGMDDWIRWMKAGYPTGRNKGHVGDGK